MPVAVFEAAHLDGVLSLCRAEGWPTLPADRDRALRVLLAPGTATVVVLGTDGEVVGFAHALSNGLTAYLAELVVAAEHRGRGVARRLVAEIFNRSGVTRLDLISTDAAEGFYETLAHRRYAGFRIYPLATP
ncbi:MAG TPA: GNAT family N-acetyltransferase [Pseudonocardiaceae bacterium]